jgi:hypothetical protein
MLYPNGAGFGDLGNADAYQKIYRKQRFILRANSVNPSGSPREAAWKLNAADHPLGGC